MDAQTASEYSRYRPLRGRMKTAADSGAAPRRSSWRSGFRTAARHSSRSRQRRGRGIPPTTSGLERRLGSSSSSTAAKNASRSRSARIITLSYHTRAPVPASVARMTNPKTSTPWGPASLVEEVSVAQRAGDKRSRRSSSSSRPRGASASSASPTRRAVRAAARSRCGRATSSDCARRSPSIPELAEALLGGDA